MFLLIFSLVPLTKIPKAVASDKIRIVATTPTLESIAKVIAQD